MRACVRACERACVLCACVRACVSECVLVSGRLTRVAHRELHIHHGRDFELRLVDAPDLEDALRIRLRSKRTNAHTTNLEQPKEEGCSALCCPSAYLPASVTRGQVGTRGQMIDGYTS